MKAILKDIEDELLKRKQAPSSFLVPQNVKRRFKIDFTNQIIQYKNS
jgi:hypothetical protein